MKYALVDGQRREPQPRLYGECPGCGQLMVAKCGSVRIHHWAHKSKIVCDYWWENETEWHRAWKNQFPADWQEFVQIAEDGERHIADVKTERGRVIEFQHSYITSRERRSRDAFYRNNVIWVVDGMRRKHDMRKFTGAWERGVPVSRRPQVKRVSYEDLFHIEDWLDGLSHVFFDFGEKSPLFLVHPKEFVRCGYAVSLCRVDFIALLCGNATKEFSSFEMFLEAFDAAVKSDVQKPRLQSSSPPLVGFENYLASHNHVRRRF